MRKGLTIALWLCLSTGSAFAVPAVVQSQIGTSSNSASTTVATPSMTTTAGNTLVAFLADYTNTGPNSVVSVTGPGQTWTQIIAPNTGLNTVSNWGMWVCYNCAALSSQVVTGTDSGASNHYLTLVVTEVSGLLSASAVDLHEFTATATTTTPTFTTSGSTAQASEIAFGFMSQTQLNATLTEASGWTTQKDTYPTAGLVPTHVATKILSATGTVTYNPTLSSGTPNNIAIVTLKDATAPTTTPAGLTTLGVGP